MKNDFNYKKLYQEQFKNLPNIRFIGTLISIGAIATIIGVILFIKATSGYSSYFSISVATIFIGWAIALGLAYLVRYITAISISQKIVVADTLLAINDAQASSPVSENELPEL